MNYNKLSDNEKTSILKKMYEKEKKSFQDIAQCLDTYANKIRRDAIRLKINIRDKSEAQKNAIKTGKHSHPTKGKKRDDNVKQKIGMSVLKSWGNLSDKDLATRKKKAKEKWENLSEDDKANMQQKANDAVRLTSKVGSKLEKFLLQRLLDDGFKVVFHQEQMLLTTKLQIDIFLPAMDVAIEIDGPSHFLPVWGDEALKRNISYDNKKSGLILGKGLVLVRIKQLRDFSKSRATLIYTKLKDLLDSIKNKFPDVNNRSFIIEDNDE